LGCGDVTNPDSNGLLPDVDQAAHFLALLDEGAGDFCFQTFDDLKSRKSKALAGIRFGPLERWAGFLASMNQQGAGVFVTVNETDGRGRKLDNIIRIRAVWHEEDIPCGKTFPLEPHLLIESSPGKFHRYWFVDDLNPADFAGIMERMIRDYGSDPNVKDTARVLRLPGFYHQKDPAAPFRSRIISESGGLPYPAARLLSAFPPLLPAAIPATASKADPCNDGGAKALVAELASRAAGRTHNDPRKGRHTQILWLGYECAQRGVPIGYARYAVKCFANLMRDTDSTGKVEDINLAAELTAFKKSWAKGAKAAPKPPRPFPPGNPPAPPLALVGVSRQGFEAELEAAGNDVDQVLRISAAIQLSPLHQAEIELLLKRAGKAIGVSIMALRKPRKHDPPGGGFGNNGQPPADKSPGSYPQRDGWERGLIEKPRGGLEDCRENVFLILSRHPEWQGIIGWNEFTRRVEKTVPTPFGSLVGEWKIGDDYETGLWLAQHCNLLLRSEATIMAGVAMCADKNKFHPPRDWLESLPVFDGVDRLEHFIADCVGCENSEYIQLIGKYFMIGIIARIYMPGCPMQYMPILEGKQGMGKSSLWRALGGDWFQDTPLKLGDKDAYMQLTGTLIYEIAELDAFNKAESTMVKGFITQENDRFREPYGRRPIDNPRQCVFVGTTNHGEYLKDTTGNRRMWPIKAVDINLDLIKALRPLLFAEALHRFNAGERWHPSRKEEREHFMPEQDYRRIVDPWLYPLQDWLDDVDQRLSNEFTVTDLLMGALKVELNKIDGNRSMATRIGNIMMEIGWERKRRLRNRRKETVYERPKIEQS
jgi:predicted P-loop ATPase